MHQASPFVTMLIGALALGCGGSPATTPTTMPPPPPAESAPPPAPPPPNDAATLERCAPAADKLWQFPPSSLGDLTGADAPAADMSPDEQALLDAALRSGSLEACARDAWRDEVIACFAAAVDSLASKACADMWSPAQSDGFLASVLAAIAGRVEAAAREREAGSQP